MWDEEVPTVKMWFMVPTMNGAVSPTCLVSYFALARLLGNLIIVWGKMVLGFSLLLVHVPPISSVN